MELRSITEIKTILIFTHTYLSAVDPSQGQDCLKSTLDFVFVVVAILLVMILFKLYAVINDCIPSIYFDKISLF